MKEREILRLKMEFFEKKERELLIKKKKSRGGFKVGAGGCRYLRSKICVVCGGILSFQMRIV